MRMEWESWNGQVESKQLETQPREEDNEEELLLKSGFGEIPSIVFTPVGIYYEDSVNRPYKKWQCFTCSTDFDIGTATFTDIIDNIEGVEAYKLLGNYTFFVGIGRLFNAQEVKRRIENEARRYYESREVR